MLVALLFKATFNLRLRFSLRLRSSMFADTARVTNVRIIIISVYTAHISMLCASQCLCACVVFVILLSQYLASPKSYGMDLGL